MRYQEGFEQIGLTKCLNIKTPFHIKLTQTNLVCLLKATQTLHHFLCHLPLVLSRTMTYSGWSETPKPCPTPWAPTHYSCTYAKKPTATEKTLSWQNSGFQVNPHRLQLYICQETDSYRKTLSWQNSGFQVNPHRLRLYICPETDSCGKTLSWQNSWFQAANHLSSFRQSKSGKQYSAWNIQWVVTISAQQAKA